MTAPSTRPAAARPGASPLRASAPLHRAVTSTPRKSRVAVSLAAVVAAACSGATVAEPERAEADGPTVVVTDMAYEPARITVQVGETVTWIFDDGAIRHDVAGDGFQSEIMAAGSFAHRFDEPATYAFVCTLHPNMTGTIAVVPG